MCKLTNFDYNNNQVRTATKGEEILFCLVDCCNVLNLKQPTRVLERLNRDGVTQIKGVSKTTNQYGITTEQEVILNFISEPNLYRVIFRSDKLEAVKFQDWVFNEVLPALRKTGKYEVGEVGPTKTELTQSKPSQSQAELVNSIGPTNRFPSQANPSVLVPQIDKSSFHTFSTYLFKLRYAFYNDTIYILLSDVDRFLEIT
ncbi:MAG: hypothetical protein LBG48_00925, partial [Rickettsiales bacterium]|nr:hypothetical protein [Rickettsiales bacterium]